MTLPIGDMLPRGPRTRGKSSFRSGPSRLRLRSTAPASVMLASALVSLVPAFQHPWVPPLGLMMFLAWRLLQPQLWPLWAGFPLGLVDDLFSGTPFGSGALIWSLVTLALDRVDARLAWYSWRRDWLIGAAALAGAVLLDSFISGLIFAWVPLSSRFPQTVLAALGFPLMERLVARLDRWRRAP